MSYSISPFELVISEIGYHFMLGLARTVIFLFALPHLARMRGVHHCAQPLFEVRSCELFAQASLELWSS
jgi:hypothetical protein